MIHSKIILKVYSQEQRTNFRHLPWSVPNDNLFYYSYWDYQAPCHMLTLLQLLLPYIFIPMVASHTAGHISLLHS